MDSPYKSLRPKFSLHQSLLDLRDELQIKTESGVYHSVLLLTPANRDRSFPDVTMIPQVLSLEHLK